MKEKQLKNQRGITLIALVVTIIVLIVLAGIAISMTVGENGIFTKAREAKRLQITAEAKEKIGAEILDAQIEATQKNEQLQQSKVEEIIAKYGELQADGDTIKLKDNGYEVSLKEIYNGSTSSSGGSTGGSTGSAELDSLKAELAQTNATEDKILKDYKAYSNGKLMTGTMANYAGQTQEVSSTRDATYTYLSIPNAGYYGTDSKLKTLNSNLSGKKIPISSITKYTATPWHGGDVSSMIDGNKDTSTYKGNVYGGHGNYLMFVIDMGTQCKLNYIKKYAYNGGDAGVSASNRIIVYGTNNVDVLTKFNAATELKMLADINLSNASIGIIPLSTDLPTDNNNPKYRYYLVISYNNGEHQSIIEIEAYA